MGSTQKEFLGADGRVGNDKLSCGHTGQELRGESGLETLLWVLSAFGGG